MKLHGPFPTNEQVEEMRRVYRHHLEETGRDPYIAAAAVLFGKYVDEVTAEDRQKVKTMYFEMLRTKSAE